MKRNKECNLIQIWRSCVAAALFCVMMALPLYAEQAAQTFLIPLPEQDVYDDFDEIESNRAGGIGTYMRSITTMVIGESNTVVYYDHWEDGYEPDVFAPTQSTSYVWGDGNTTNGYLTAYPSDIFTPGDVITLDNDITIPRNATNVYYDARDKVSVTQPIALTRAMYPDIPGPLMAGAVQALDTTQHGLFYVAPVGEDLLYNNTFDYVGMNIMASENPTLVSVDTNADGVVDIQQWLEEGEVISVNGGIMVGATVSAEKPIQVHMLAGKDDGGYKVRLFTMFPRYQWSDEYVTPVSSINASGGDTEMFLHNPNSSAITVNYETTSTSGSISIAAGATEQYTLPFNSGARFYSSGEEPFVALSTISGGSYQAFDWGFSPVPSKSLSTMIMCGLGWGSSDFSGNFSPVWITAVSNTTIYIDYDSDPTTGAYIDSVGNHYDASNVVNRLASTVLYNPTTNDQTRMRMYTLDGVYLSGAWGSYPANPPTPPGGVALDMGTTLMPFPSIVVRKTHEIWNDVNGDGKVNPGDSLKYILTVANNGFQTANSVIVHDKLPANVTYMTGSFRTNDISSADDTIPPASTPFPLDEDGYDVGALGVGGKTRVSYVLTVDASFPLEDGVLINSAHAGASEGQWQDVDPVRIEDPTLEFIKTSSATAPLELGDTVTYTLTVKNTGSHAQNSLRITEQLPSSMSYVANSTEYVITTNTVQKKVRDNFNDVSYSNNNGSADWVADWIEIGESDGPAAGFMTVSNSLSMSASGRGVRRMVDMSGFSNALLRLTYKRDFVTNANQTVMVDVSDDGGSSWHSLQTLDSSQNDPIAGISALYDLSEYISANTMVRLMTGGTGWSNGYDRVYFDGVEIEYTKPGDGDGPTHTGSAPPTLVELDSLAPYTIMTVTFDATVVSIASSQIVNSAYVVSQSQQTELYGLVTNDVASADLAVSKVADDLGPYDVGDDISFTVVITNNGSSAASGVEVTETWPASYVTLSGTALSQGSYISASNIWNVGSLAVGASASMVVSGVVNSVSGISHITNVVEITASNTRDSESSNNVASAVVDVSSSLGDVVWLDLDGDGIQDGGETGASNVVVKLYNQNSNLVATTTTDTSGAYLFDDLFAGDYYVEVSTSYGYGISPQNVGGDDTVDSDVNSSGWSSVISLSSGETNNDIDIGIYKYSEVGDFVWYDTNENGTQDVSEVGASGVAVSLYRDADGDGIIEPDGDDGAAIRSTNTYNYLGHDGYYNFTELDPGDYYIRFGLLDGMAFTTQDAGSDDAGDSDADIAGGWTDIFTLQSGDVDNSFDAGFVLGASGLGITKTSDTAGVDQNPGDTITYTITVQNTGTVSLAGVSVVDTLPAGVTYVPGSTEVIYMKPVTNTVRDEFNSQLYSNNNGTKNWSNNWTDEQNASPTAGRTTVRTGVDGNYSLRLQNDLNNIWRSADLSGSTSATLSLLYRRQALNKAAEWAGVRVATNSTATWTTLAQYIGLGTDDAFISVSYDITSYISDSTTISLWNDDLPMGNGDYVWFDDVQISYVIPTLSTNAGGAAPNLVTGYTLATGETITVTFDVTVDSGTSATQLVNSATAVSAGGSPVSATVTDAVAYADIAVTKTAASGGPYDIGEVVAYTITVTNNGPNDATGIELTDTWPDSLNYSGNSLSQGSYNSGSHIWDIGSLSLGSSATLMVSGVVNSVSAPAGITNVATITASDLYDPVDGNNSDDVTVTVAAVLGNRVWLDEDGDGIQDVGESGLSNVTVRIYDDQDTLIDTVTTDTNGIYQFTGLTAGDYYIEVVKPSGYEFTLSDVGVSNAVDSDVNQATGKSALVTLSSGEHNDTVDAGLHLSASVGDYAWYDVNKDGLQDAGESGTNGVQVFLYRDADGDGVVEPDGEDGAAVGTNTTYNNGGDGYYEFSGYAPGNYFLKFVLPAEMAFSDSNIGSNDTVDSDVDAFSGLTEIFTLLSGTNVTTWDAGLVDAVKGLGITKTSNTSGVPQNPGDVITYTITVSNTGVVTQAGVSVTDTLPPELTYVNGSTKVIYYGSTTNTVRDEFASLSYGNNDGTANWLNNWTDTQDGNAIAGDIRILQDNNGAYSLRFRDDNNSIWRSADISSATTATLKLLYRRNALDSSSEWVRLRASTNNTDWTTLVDYAGAATDSSYISASYNLTSYISTNTTISFWNDNRGMDINDTVWFDDIEIEYVTESSITNSGNSAPNLASGYTLEAGRSLIVTFDAVVNTPIGVTQVVNTATAVADGLASISATVTDSIAYADIAVDKIADSAGPYSVGDVASFTIVVTNNGPNAATGIEVSDTWPANFITFSGATSSQGGYNSGSHTWSVGSLSNGSFASLVVSGIVNNANAPDGVTNVVSVISSDVYDPVTSNNTDDAVIQLSAIIGDKIWLDDDGDGRQDFSENGLSNVTVRLYDVDTNLLATTVTASDGSYEFDHLNSGSYYVEVVQPAGYEFTKQGFGSDGTIDSDVDQSSGFADLITVAAAENNNTVDAGLYQTVTIGDFVWYDSDSDGIQDGGEPGTNGVQVILYGDTDGDGVIEVYGDDSVPVATTNTYNNGADGYYEFNSIPPGDYFVKFVLPTGMSFTDYNAGSDDAVDSDAYFANGLSTTIRIASGDSDFDWDAGLINAVAGLAVTKTSDTGGAWKDPGDIIRYTIVVSNTGTVEQVGVDVVDVLPASLNYVAGSTRIIYPVLVTNTISDTFNQISYTNNNGDFEWNNGWTDVEDDDPAAGFITVRSGVNGAYSLRLQSDNNEIWRSADIADAVSATLSLKYRRDSLDKAVEWVQVRIADDTNGTWNTLAQYEGAVGDTTDAAFISASYDISSYISSNTTVSFWNDDRNMGNGDYVWFDDVEIAFTTYGTATNIWGTTPNLASGYTLPPGSSMTIIFDAQIDTPSQVTQIVNTATAAAIGSLSVSGSVTDNVTYADTALTKELADQMAYQPGDQVSFTITVTNKGPFDVQDAKVLDAWPSAQLIFDSATVSKGSYIAASNIWEIGDMALDATETMIVSGRVATVGSSFVITNTATISAAQNDLFPDNNSDEDIVVIGARIGDRVWLDEDGNGVQNAGEDGVGNVIVLLLDSNDVQVASTVTDNNGVYIFDRVYPGDYKVKVDTNSMAAGLAANPTYDLDGLNDGIVSLTVEPGDTIMNLDFGYNWTSSSSVTNNIGTGAIGDWIWNDANGDGAQNAGESGISNVVIRLYGDADLDGVYDTLVATTTSDTSGHYIFDGLDPAAYVVEVNGGAALSGTTLTGDPDAKLDNKSNPIILAPGDVYVNADFGYQYDTSYTIGDTIYLDVDRSGGLDGGDTRIKDVTVSLVDDRNGNGLFDADEPIIATTITDSNGEYAFAGIVDGDYVVVVTDNRNLLGAFELVNDPDSNRDGRSAVTVAGADELTEDFGYTPVGHESGVGVIGDTIYLDSDGDMTADAGEGLGGVIVELYKNDLLVASTTTDRHGNYYFGGLLDDTYSVVVDTNSIPVGMNISSDPDGGADNKSTVTIDNGSADFDQDFGYTVAVPNSISGTVWRDINADGYLGTNEIGFASGIYVDLLNTNGTVIATTEIDASGNYSFNMLPDGTYLVDVRDDDKVLAGYWQSSGTNNVDNNSQTDPYTVVLAGGEDNVTADFGYFSVGSMLGGWVWLDNDDNDIQSMGDTGITNHLVTMDVIYGAVTTTVVTLSDNNGYYRFDNLMLDEGNTNISYFMTTGVPASLYAVLPLAREDDTIDSNYVTNTVPLVVRGVTDVSSGSSADTTLSGAATYDFGFDIHPTLVVISAFGAKTVDGQVSVYWEVEFEVGTFGYYLERQVSGYWVRVNNRIIKVPPFGYRPAPYHYSAVDSGAEAGGTYTWRVVELDNQGKLHNYGPYTVTVDGAVISYESWAANMDWLGTDSSRTADADGDALSNFEEYLANTDPLNENSLLRISDLSMAVQNNIIVRWQSVSNIIYSIEFSTNIVDGWLPISNNIQATPPMNTSTVAIDAADSPQMFFRIIGK